MRLDQVHQLPDGYEDRGCVTSRDAVQSAITALCAYEIVAIGTGKMPTVSTLCRKHRSLEALFLAWLMVHLHREQKHAQEQALWLRYARQPTRI